MISIRSPLEQYWIKLWLQGKAPSLDDMAIANAAAARGRFSLRPSRQSRTSVRGGTMPSTSMPASMRSTSAIGARSARRRPRTKGVSSTSRKTARTATSARSSSPMAASFPPTCSSIAPGFRGLLIEETLQVGLRGLVALAAVRPRPRGADRERAGQSDAVHPFDRAGVRLAVAHPAPAPDRQWPCLLERLYQRGARRRSASRNRRHQAARRAAPAQVQGRPAEEPVGRATSFRSALPPASSNRSNRPASILSSPRLSAWSPTSRPAISTRWRSTSITA